MIAALRSRWCPLPRVRMNRLLSEGAMSRLSFALVADARVMAMMRRGVEKAS